MVMVIISREITTLFHENIDPTLPRNRSVAADRWTLLVSNP